jgi:hypothetical protein
MGIVVVSFKGALPSGAWPPLPIQWHCDWAIFVPICFAAAESKKETGIFSSIGVAPGLSCFCVAFGTHFCKHSAYLQVSPWDFFFQRKTFSTFPSSFRHEDGRVLFVFKLIVFVQLNKCLVNTYTWQTLHCTVVCRKSDAEESMSLAFKELVAYQREDNSERINIIQ